MRHAYYAAVSWLDHNLGTVLNGLETEGLKDDTVVLLHGDHGSVSKTVQFRNPFAPVSGLLHR